MFGSGSESGLGNIAQSEYSKFGCIRGCCASGRIPRHAGGGFDRRPWMHEQCPLAGVGRLPPGCVEGDQHQDDGDGRVIERCAGAAVDLFVFDRSGLFARAFQLRNQHAKAHAE